MRPAVVPQKRRAVALLTKWTSGARSVHVVMAITVLVPVSVPILVPIPGLVSVSAPNSVLVPIPVPVPVPIPVPVPVPVTVPGLGLFLPRGGVRATFGVQNATAGIALGRLRRPTVRSPVCLTSKPVVVLLPENVVDSGNASNVGGDGAGSIVADCPSAVLAAVVVAGVVVIAGAIVYFGDAIVATGSIIKRHRRR